MDMQIDEQLVGEKKTLLLLQNNTRFLCPNNLFAASGSVQLSAQSGNAKAVKNMV
jgi:hypothetical protein